MMGCESLGGNCDASLVQTRNNADVGADLHDTRLDGHSDFLADLEPGEIASALAVAWRTYHGTVSNESFRTIDPGTYRQE